MGELDDSTHNNLNRKEKSPYGNKSQKQQQQAGSGARKGNRDGCSRIDEEDGQFEEEVELAGRCTAGAKRKT